MNRPSPDDMKAMQVMEYVEQLEKKYKELKEENKELKAYKSCYILLKERINGGIETQNELETENKTLKKRLEQLEKEIEDLKYSTKWSSLGILFVGILLIIADLLGL